MVVTPELLRFFPLLRSLPPGRLELLAPLCTVQRLARRAVVLQAGNQESMVCFLFEGRLQGVDFTVDGREVGLYFVEPGDFCGELSLFDYGPQPEFVIVLSPAVVVGVPVAALRELMPDHPSIMQQLGMRLAADHFPAAPDDTAALAAGHAQHCTARVLPVVAAGAGGRT